MLKNCCFVSGMVGIFSKYEDACWLIWLFNLLGGSLITAGGRLTILWKEQCCRTCMFGGFTAYRSKTTRRKMKKRLAQLAIGSLIAVAPFATPFLLQGSSAVSATGITVPGTDIGIDCQGGGACCAHTSDPNHPDACAPTPPPPPCAPDCLPPIEGAPPALPLPISLP